MRVRSLPIWTGLLAALAIAASSLGPSLPDTALPASAGGACTDTKVAAHDNTTGADFGQQAVSLYFEQWSAQKFTPSATVQLTRASLALSNINSTQDALGIEIRADLNGHPGPVLARTYGKSTSFVGFPFVDFSFALSPILLQAGTTYYVNALTTAGFNDGYLWAQETPQGPGDHTWRSATQGQSWTPGTTTDHFFQIWGCGIPTATPTASPTQTPTLTATATGTIMVPGANLITSITDVPDPVDNTGSDLPLLTYFVVVTNNGTVATSTDFSPNGGELLRIHLPFGLEVPLDAATPNDPGVTCDYKSVGSAGDAELPGAHVDFACHSQAPLGSGQSYLIRVTTRVFFFACSPLTAVVIADPLGVQTEANESDNRAAATTTVLCAGSSTPTPTVTATPTLTPSITTMATRTRTPTPSFTPTSGAPRLRVTATRDVAA